MIGQETCPKRLAALLIAICGGLLPWQRLREEPGRRLDHGVDSR